jgi:putative spermidine/putrescine transport system permease protein
LLAVLVCLPAAYAFARLRFPGRQALLLSFLATNAFPRFGLYVSIAIVFFRLNLVGTVAGVVLIQLVNTLLLMIWIPTSAFQGVDQALEEAALDVLYSTRYLVYQGDQAPAKCNSSCSLM